MSILLLLIFLSTLLILGFGWGAWTLAGVVILLSAGISFFMVGVDIETVKANWSERRCDLDVLMTSFMYKPGDDPRPRSEFSTENFNFCVGRMFEESMKVFLTPIMSLFSNQMDSMNALQETFNILRDLKATVMKQFLSILQPFYERYKLVAMQYAVNYQRMKAAFSRVGALALNIFYLALSSVTAMMNGIDLIVLVVTIILWIMAALIFLLWFPLLPFIFILILPLIDGITEAGYSEYTGGLRGPFCFDPETKIQMKDGSIRLLRELQLGDVLQGDTIVEGILETDASKEKLYSLDGIHVSGSHLVWSEDEQKWIPVRDCKDAKSITNTLTTLLCLRTSTRTIPITGVSGSKWLFRDWEELPLSISQSDRLWDYLVSMILNKQAPTSAEVPKEDPLLGKRCRVRYRTGERVAVSQIKIGDEIYSEAGFTKVLGVYIGVASLESDTAMTDGVWLLPVATKRWHHPPLGKEGVDRIGYHLVTESGSFWAETDVFSGFVRDFTEVGCDQLFLTYGFTEALLERATRIKKSLNREESCVQDFLLRDSLSCSSPIF